MMKDLATVRVDGRRIKRTLIDIAKVGATPKGGVHRLTLTDEDKEVRGLLIEWLKDAGLKVWVDEIGNIFGRREGAHQKSTAVLTGSHLDTQPLGGKFDGAYGVMAALETVRALNDMDLETERPIEVVSWTNEEGSRFSPALTGSGVFTGRLTLDYAYSLKDKEGKNLGEELARIGYKGSVPCKPRRVHSYLELHIEQGPVLESAGKSIGVVQGIVGICWVDAWIEGESNQAGPTPMAARRDPIVAMAEIVRGVRYLPLRAEKDLVTTVGQISVTPNSRNTIAGRVDFTVDLRSTDSGTLDQALKLLRSELSATARREGVKAGMRVLWRLPYTPFGSKCISAVEESARQLGYSYMPIVSGAGHDANHLSTICPTGMAFVPSIRGRSHCEDERTTWRDLEKGANVLLHSVCRLAGLAR